MTFAQTITPNPHIECRPGWCLEYVNNAFGVKEVYGSATAAWEGSTTQHRDRNFPPGVWLPVWYGLDTTPLGHVVLRAPDGSVYSTSDLTNTPHHHTDLADLEAYYAYYGMTLIYRGWTEDVEGTRVITDTLEDILATLTDKEKADLMSAVRKINRYVDAPIGSIPGKVAGALLDEPVTRAAVGGKTSLRSTLAYLDKNLNAIRDALKAKGDV